MAYAVDRNSGEDLAGTRIATGAVGYETDLTANEIGGRTETGCSLHATVGTTFVAGLGRRARIARRWVTSRSCSEEKALLAVEATRVVHGVARVLIHNAQSEDGVTRDVGGTHARGGTIVWRQRSIAIRIALGSRTSISASARGIGTTLRLNSAVRVVGHCARRPTTDRLDQVTGLASAAADIVQYISIRRARAAVAVNRTGDGILARLTETIAANRTGWAVPRASCISLGAIADSIPAYRRGPAVN